MTKPDFAARAAAMHERAQNTMRELSENPDLAKGVIGTVVLALLKSGDEISTEAIIAELEAAAAGTATKTDLASVLARGALKVIFDLRDRPES